MADCNDRRACHRGVGRCLVRGEQVEGLLEKAGSGEEGCGCTVSELHEDELWGREREDLIGNM